jgi:hypothetical protein
MPIVLDGTTGINTPSVTGLTTPVSVAQGGTGAATLTSGSVLVGAGTGAISSVAPSTSGNVLTSNGTAWTSAAAPTKARYVSSAQTITSAGLLTLAHGLGAVPYNVMISVVCTSANNGYSVGDVLLFPAAVELSGSAFGIACYVDATNINIRFGNTATNALAALAKGTGATALLTNTAWQLYVRAEL